MKKIICAGHHRSGSTLLYNIIRFILQNSGFSLYSCFVNAYDPSVVADFHLIKTHKFHKNLLDSEFIFTTRRDLRDVAASAVKRNLVLNQTAPVIAYLQEIMVFEYEPWSSHSCLEICYEKMFFDKKTTVELVSEKLGVSTDSMLVLKDLENLQIPRDKKDMITQLHPNHIVSGNPKGYLNILSSDVIKEIELKFNVWLSKNGYLIIKMI